MIVACRPGARPKHHPARGLLPALLVLMAAGLLWAPGRAGAEEPRFEPGLAEEGFLPREPEGESTVPASALSRLLAAGRASNSDALIVLSGGRVVAERYYGRSRGPADLWSVTKSISALAIGALVADGKLPSLDEPVARYFPEAGWTSGRKARVTLRHLLTHTSGIEHRPTIGVLMGQPDRVRFVLRSPVVDEPGTRFSYSNEAVQLLAGVVRQVTGAGLDELVDDRLLRPLGVTGWRWAKDRAGNVTPFTGLTITARDLARLGQLLLDGGQHGGKALLPPSWIEQVTRPQPLNVKAGLLFWVTREGDRADGRVLGYHAQGWLGQYLAVYPAARLVVVRLHRSMAGGGIEENQVYGMGRFLSLCQALQEATDRRETPHSASQPSAAHPEPAPGP
jgi:CubicO group peptidase (beta-lactamase class C family)